MKLSLAAGSVLFQMTLVLVTIRKCLRAELTVILDALVFGHVDLEVCAAAKSFRTGFAVEAELPGVQLHVPTERRLLCVHFVTTIALVALGS